MQFINDLHARQTGAERLQLPILLEVWRTLLCLIKQPAEKCVCMTQVYLIYDCLSLWLPRAHAMCHHHHHQYLRCDFNTIVVCTFVLLSQKKEVTDLSLRLGFLLWPATSLLGTLCCPAWQPTDPAGASLSTISHPKLRRTFSGNSSDPSGPYRMWR